MTQRKLTALEAFEMIIADLDSHDEAINRPRIENVRAALNTTPTCPIQYQGKGGFFAYDFMPQRVMFKGLGSDQTAINVLQMRGWGYLTGQGQALKLPEKEAAKIQDQFGHWVADTLNKANLVPELVSALTALIEQCEFAAKIRGGEGHLSEALKQGREAIAKAEGAE